MLVSTNQGNIYKINSAGTPSLIASVGEDTEGMDIASTAYGKYAGQLLVSSEGSGRIRAIKADGTVSVLQAARGGDVHIASAETVSVVPLNLGASGNPLEGFYVANYAVDIQFAPASQFTGLNGNAIVTSEFGSNSTVWLLSYNGDGLDTFDVTAIGALPNQSEDGIFVTAERIIDVTTPEPTSVALLGIGLAGVALTRRRKVA